MKQHRPNRKRHILNPEDIRELCHEAMPVGEDARPVKAIGWTDQRGRWTRLEAEYPNGWVLSVSLGEDGRARNVTSRLNITVGKATLRSEK